MEVKFYSNLEPLESLRYEQSLECWKDASTGAVAEALEALGTDLVGGFYAKSFAREGVCFKGGLRADVAYQFDVEGGFGGFSAVELLEFKNEIAKSLGYGQKALEQVVLDLQQSAHSSLADKTQWIESVRKDIEQGRNGYLYAVTLCSEGPFYEFLSSIEGCVGAQASFKLYEDFCCYESLIKEDFSRGTKSEKFCGMYEDFKFAFKNAMENGAVVV